ncbi:MULTISPECIES: hypothetical protein [Chromobacterium]|uniref:hypothetical protein n=1 Tax=Chromobacterium TaxID=535 RepID=UPI0020BD7491|nr:MULTISPECIES: hypothetical protein [Chromobacterium]MDH0340920.1 hypothetical protein [Chromobacterium haemolyticum]
MKYPNEVYQEESKLLPNQATIKNFNKPDLRAEFKTPFSLAISGGGVRSAAVARGFLEFLQESNLSKIIRYLSSVSGGGYAACEFLHEQEIKKRKQHSTNLNYTLSGFIYPIAMEFFSRLVFIFSIGIAAGHTLEKFNFSLFSESAEQLLVFSNLTVIALGATLAFVTTKLKLLKIRKALLFLVMIYTYFLISIIPFLKFGLLTIPIATAVIIAIAFYFSRMPHRASQYSIYNGLDKLIAYPIFFLSAIYIHDKHQGYESIIINHTITILILLFICFFTFRLSNKTWPKLSLFDYYTSILQKTYLPNSDDYNLNDLNKSPYPIINITANNGVSKFQSELTPKHILLNDGNYQTLSGGVSLKHAMAASGSAMDYVKLGWGIETLSLFFPGTGYWRNPKHYNGSFPGIINLLQLFLAIPTKNYMRLSDGGFTENLGLLALFRRHEKNIVCLDSGHDPEYLFGDLRLACNKAISDGLIDKFSIDGLVKFKNQLDFSSNEIRHIKIPFIYSNQEGGTLWLVKLNSPKSAMRKQYIKFPQITTSDQMLTNEELEELQKIGYSMAEEIFTARKFSNQKI